MRKLLLEEAAGDTRRITRFMGGFLVRPQPQPNEKNICGDITTPATATKAPEKAPAKKAPAKKAPAKKTPAARVHRAPVSAVAEPAPVVELPTAPATPATPKPLSAREQAIANISLDGTGPRSRPLFQAPTTPSRPRQPRPSIKVLAETLKDVGPKIEPGVGILGSTKEERERRAKERAEQRQANTVVVSPVIDLTDEALAGRGFRWDDVDLGEMCQRLLERYRDGLPTHVGYSYLPDVLALYGLDQDLVESALRFPERVEVRPESYAKDKRYAVLGFWKGDVNVILGLKDPTKPTIIACYVTSRLEHDHHRVGHTGGGGKRAEGGLPKTPGQLATRLRALGAHVAVDARNDTAPVSYGGQELGSISCGSNVTRDTVESDFQRMQRKIHAIQRRESAVAAAR